MNQLTKQDILDIATELVEINGVTTTLEIKLEARNKGFFAEQATVSSLITELVKEGQLAVSGSNGQYRYITLVVTAALSSTDDQSASTTVSLGSATAPTTPAVTTPTTAVQHRDGNITNAKPIPSTLTKTGDWVVTSVDSTEEMYFLGDISRDAARSAFAKLSADNVTFTSTRSSRLK